MRWVVFIAVFSSIYIGFHVYAFWKVGQAVPFGRGLYAFSLVFILGMVSIPFLVRFLERAGHDGLARPFALAGFTWMGFLFLFVCAAFLEDGYRVLIKGASVFSGKMNPHWLLSRQAALFTILAVSGGITFYGFVDAMRIRTEHVVIRTAKMDPGMNRFRIVQISDVHLGLIVRKERFAGIVEKIRAAGPDLLVSTGDLVDGSMDHREGLAAMLKELPVKHGKFAVTGNHEYYAGIGRSLDFIEKAGFTLVRGEAVPFLPWLSIAGVDDPAGGSFGNPPERREKEILSHIPKDRFSLLLKHRPHLDESALGLFDLQLSGHTHKGQIFPFTLIIKSLYPIDAGRLNLDNGSTLYVSRGTGTWGPPIRFLSPPEVTVIDLVPAKN